MKLGVWIILITIVSSAVHANECTDLFASSKKKVSEQKSAKKRNVEVPSSKKELDEKVDAVAAFVEKSGRIPTERELAKELGVTVESLKEFLNKRTTPDIEDMVAIAKQAYPNVFKMYEAKLAQKAAEYLEENLALPTLKQLAEALNVTQRDIQAIYGGNKDILARISEYERRTLEKVTDSLIKLYVKTARAYGRTPTLEEMASMDGSKYSLESLQRLIGKSNLINELGDLHKMAEAKNPQSLKGVVNLEIYNDQRFDDLMKDIKNDEKFVVTSSIAGAPANKEFLAAIQVYNKAHKASLFVKPINNETGGLDEAFHTSKKTHVLISEVEPSSELKISNIPITAKQINPLMGLHRIGKRGQSMIVGSPKAHLDAVATKENQYRPHLIMSTGSINDPNVYQGKQYISKRTDYLAERDHFMGALVVEKTAAQDGLVGGVSTGTFHYRYIQYIPEKRGFMDLNKFYTAEGVQEVRAEAIAFGDTHVAQTDHRIVYPIRMQILGVFKPKKVVLHDLLDGQSISHYERDKAITLAQKSERGQLSLKDELDLTVDYMKGFFASAPVDTVFYVPDANHNNWLMRYLEAGQFMKEPANTKLGLELAQVMESGRNPLEYYFEKSLGTKYTRRIVFLALGESLYAGPEHRKVLISDHGDKGANGAKGSLGAFMRGADGSASGHTHFVQIRNNTVIIGTNTEVPMGYAKGGMSNWVQAVSVIGPNGEQQLLMYRNGEWYRDTSRSLPKSEEFFEEGYPYSKPNNNPTDAIQVDQYTTKHKD